MQSRRARLDRFISSSLQIKRSDVRLTLAQRRVKVDGHIVDDGALIIDQFSHICVDGKVLQDEKPRYVMLHKAKGVVSATRDKKHKTVLGYLPESQRTNLHIAGRLDFNSTGLVLLTNDGNWSKRLSHPDYGVAKCYRVCLDKPLDQRYVDAFQKGFQFDYEGIITRPAGLRIVDDFTAEVTLFEGRYHQIKRMFGYFQNTVVGLHRYAIGGLVLDSGLSAGEYRDLSYEQAEAVFVEAG